MFKATQRFLTKAGVVAAFAAAVIFCLQSYTTALNGFENFAWYSLLFMLVIAAVSYQLLLRGIAIKGHAYFMQYFSIMFAFKAFSSLLFVGYFIFVQPIDNKKFVLPFFVLYAIYTGLIVSEAKIALDETKS